MTVLLFFTDHLPVTTYEEVVHRIEQRKAHSYEEDDNNGEHAQSGGLIGPRRKHLPATEPSPVLESSMDILSTTNSVTPLVLGDHHKENQRPGRH